jgi:hypothetical protein
MSCNRRIRPLPPFRIIDIDASFQDKFKRQLTEIAKSDSIFIVNGAILGPAGAAANKMSFDSTDSG